MSLTFNPLRLMFAALLLGLSLSFEQTAAQGTISVQWVADPADATRTMVEVTGLDGNTLRRLRQVRWSLAQWQQILAVYTETEGASTAPAMPPMLGVYDVEGNRLRFTPQFPLEAGLSYRAVYNPQRSGQQAISAVYRRPRPERAATTIVEMIYPSADVLPENLLKFYLHFSAPMSRGRIYDYIRLRDADGRTIELPFLEIDEELWDPGMRRLTLFIDPGRIKRGVRPLEEIGPSLEAGRRYTLIIDREWRDANGEPLRAAFEKTFSVGPADREPPDPARWRLQTPPAGTREPLIVIFSEPMDHALALRVIQVADGSGRMAAGKTSLEDAEKRWMFTPEIAWRGGRHHLVVQTTIEDLAGNNIGKPFEVDLFEGVERRLTTPTVKLAFEVR